MNEFSHLRTVVSVLVGLALSNVATSIHHLLRERHRVRWDWLSPCAALMATLLILHFWFIYYSFGNIVVLTRLGPTLLLLLEILLAVLLACSALPDGANELDLRRYYADQSRYFWLVASCYLAGTLAWNLVLSPAMNPLGRLGLWRDDLIMLGLFILLALVRRRQLHEVLVPLLCLFYFIAFFNLHLG